MADCSSSIGFSNIGILQNEVISRKKLVFGSVGFRNSVKEASLPVFSVKVSFRHVNVRRKQNIVVMRTMPPYDRSLSGVAADTNQEDEGKRTSGKETKGVVSEYEQKIDGGGGGGDGDGGLDGDVDVLDGSGGNGKPPNGEGGGGGGDNGGDENGGDKEEGEFGRVLSYGEVMREVEASGASLPSDMLEAAKSVGIHELLLRRYLDLQGAAWPLGFGMKSCSMLRNRMLADPSFLFKVGAEIVIDSVCATLAEVQKRGKDFWAEFELYTADLLVGVAVNVALVGMLAPYVRFGQPSLSNGLLGRWQNACAALPSSVFEAERLGQTFSVQQRIATYFYKGILYASVGFGCGIVGQGITNLIMIAKRRVKKSEDDIPVPPLVKSAALWGVFLGVSSNTRYQVINGLERVVEGSPLAKQFPPVALAFTVGVRLTNNIFGAMQFVDWAKWSGCQ